MKKFIVVGIMIVLAGTSCSKFKNGSEAGTITDPHVVAMIGSEKIMDSDIDAFLSQIPEQARERYSSPEGRKEFVTQLAEIKMMAMAAKKKGMDKNPDIQRKLAFMSDQVLARGYAETAVDGIKISDDEIAKFYNDNKDRFAVGPRVKLRHILVDGEPQAADILAQLKGGADFSALAKEKSKCPSSRQGGDLGWTTRGTMVPEFETAAFALKKGEMSGIVKTQFGYHIIMCDDAEAGRVMELSEARGLIEKQIRGDRGDEVVKALIDQVKKEYPVVINDAYFAKVRQGGAQEQPKP